MSKKQEREAYYFPHEYHAASDPKLQALIGEFGGTGYGIYWRLVEMLHSEEHHALPMKPYLFEAIAKQMLVESSMVEAIVKQSIAKFDLLKTNDGFFYSERVFRNFEKRKEISEKRAQSGKLGAIARKEKETLQQLLSGAKQ